MAEQLVEQAWKADLKILALKAKNKKLPMKEKIARGTDLKELLDKARTLHDHEIMRNKETVEQQVKAERITKLIQPVQQRIHEFTHALSSTSLKHPSNSSVQELEQQAEEACQDIERTTPILAQFQQNIGKTTQFPRKDRAAMEAAEELREETGEAKHTANKGI